MPMNYPGPYVLVTEYLVGGLTHHQTINLACEYMPQPGETFDNIKVVCKDSTLSDLNDVADEYADLLAAFHDAASDIVAMELFECSPLSFDRKWISAYTVGIPGTNVGTYQPACEYIQTFRTQEGGIMQLRHEEVVMSTYGRFPAGGVAPGGPDDDLITYVLKDSSWILARDTSYPVAALYVLRGQNESIFKLRYR
jgi:hypothetical protein